MTQPNILVDFFVERVDWSNVFSSSALVPANLSTEGYSDLLSENPSGVYFGWAGLAKRGVYKMVMSIGWNPYFNNSEKTIVSHLYYRFCNSLMLLAFFLLVSKCYILIP